MYANRYVQFCKVREVDFSDNSNIPFIANFLCEIADASDCPESVLCIVSAVYRFSLMRSAKPRPLLIRKLKDS